LPRTEPAPPQGPIPSLAGAEAALTRPADCAAVLATALAAAPDAIELRLAAYRFHFFRHDYPAALAEARAILLLAARRLNIGPDPALVAPQDADFTAHDFAPGLYLQALVGIGYCAARMGDLVQAEAALGKAAALDPTDRFGGAWLLARCLAGDAAAEAGEPAR